MEKYFIIPKEEQERFDIKLEWFTAIEPIQIENGNYILNYSVMELLKKYDVLVVYFDKEIQQEKKVVAKEEILKYELKDRKDIVFKVYEEKIIIIK